VRGRTTDGDCFVPGLSDTCSFSLINQLPTQSVLLIIVDVCTLFETFFSFYDFMCCLIPKQSDNNELRVPL
jgi:hypothetical protein